MAWFEGQKFGSELLEHNLSIMREAGRKAPRDAGLPEDFDPHESLEGNAALGAEVLRHLRILEGHRRHKRVDDAIHETANYSELTSLLSRRFRKRLQDRTGGAIGTA